MKTVVMGDIHGAYRAMTPVLQLAGFDYENDRLIQIGDVVDGWPDAVAGMEELMKIKKRIAVRGNHDCWLYNWLSSGRHDIHWSEFGGNVKMSDSIRKEKEDDKRHLRFLKNRYDYFIDEYDSA